jgi:DNA-binding PadR family transcriptional regulator
MWTDSEIREVGLSSPVNATAASLLGFLQSGSMSGWELAEAVEATIGNFWNVTRSQIYRELGDLSERGLVEPGAPGPRNRRRYAITASGRKAFADWIRREPGRELIRFPLLLTLFFADQVPLDELARFVDTHRRYHQDRLTFYRGMMEGAPESSPRVQTLRFGILYEETFLKWLDSVNPTPSPQGPVATVAGTAAKSGRGRKQP